LDVGGFNGKSQCVNWLFLEMWTEGGDVGKLEELEFGIWNLVFRDDRSNRLKVYE